jgi:hypothetical protein
MDLSKMKVYVERNIMFLLTHFETERSVDISSVLALLVIGYVITGKVLPR